MTESEFDRHFGRAQSDISENNRVTNLLLHIVVPLALALLGIFTKDLWSFHIAIPIVLWSFLLVIYVGVWWKVYPKYDDVFSILSKLREAEKTIELYAYNMQNVENITRNLYIKNVAAFAFRTMSLEFVRQLKEKEDKSETCDEMLSDILSAMYLQGDILFGFEISEKWNFCVYFYNKDEGLLQPAWRRKAETHPSDGLGRNWRPGEGHVGKCFLDRRPILTGNANDASVAQLCRARDAKLEDYDNSTYVSFASVPITCAKDDNEDPYGVLVVTSDVEGRFSDEGATELLMHAAETISLIFELSGTDAGCFVNKSE